jgi:hypothetical protein
VKYESLFERLVANTRIPDDQIESTGCWHWTGRTDPKGYPIVSVRVPGRKSPVGRRAHRIMKAIIEGRELHPDNDTVEHQCLNTSCINPDHTTLMTRVENSADMQRRRKAAR